MQTTTAYPFFLGHVATPVAAQPLWTGPRLVFDGVNDVLSASSGRLGLLLNWTLFVVVELDPTLDGLAGAIYEEYAADTEDRLGLYHLRGNTPGLERRVSFVYKQGASNIGSVSTVDIAGTGRRVVAVRRAGSVLDLFVDGAHDRTNTISGNALSGTLSRRLGGSGDAINLGYADGAIGRVLAVSGAVSDAQVAAYSALL